MTMLIYLRDCDCFTSIHVLFKAISGFPEGWSGDAMVLGKLPVPGGPINLDNSRARAYCACSRRGWGYLDIFSLIYHFSLLSPSLCEMARYRLSQRAVRPKQPTNRLVF